MKTKIATLFLIGILYSTASQAQQQKKLTLFIFRLFNINAGYIINGNGKS